MSAPTMLKVESLDLNDLTDTNLILGDSLLALQKLSDDCVDLTVTSPPYDNLRAYNGYSFEFEKIAKELYRVTKPGGVVVWVVADATKNGSETGTSFRQALYFKDVCGFNLHDTMIYASDKPPLTHNRYEQKFEYMFILAKGRPNTFNPIMEDCKYAGDGKHARTFRHTGADLDKTHQTGSVKDKKIKGNIWTYPTGYNKSTKDKQAFKHPAIFPESLAEDHILTWSSPGDWIMDPFVGSGTTGKMARIHGRRFIGIDVSSEYINIARERLTMPIENDLFSITY